MKKYALFLGLMLLTGAAQAGIWGDWIAGGTACNRFNVSVLENGDTLAVLFDEFGINMPLGDFGEGASVRKTCSFRISLKPKNGLYLAGFKQVYSGGLIKSRNSSAQLNIRYNVGTIMGTPLPIVFPRGVTIRPEDPGSSFAKTYNNNLLVMNCNGVTNYGINMQLSGVRSSVFSDYLIGGLDSVDADFVQRLELIPVWAVCPRR